jgi:bacitracin synthase 3
VRWLPSGHLEYLGRWDNQIKIRGHRVEPGEAASLLLTHPNVREAFVVAHETAAGARFLVAYVVLAQPTASADLKDFLDSLLPSFMSIESVTTVDQLPLTPNGKVDVSLLPIPPLPGESNTRFVAPGSPLETELAQIWADVLNVSRVSASDNFFALGGDSLLSIRVLNVARNQGIDLSLRQILEARTLRDLATHATRAGD